MKNVNAFIIVILASLSLSKKLIKRCFQAKAITNWYQGASLHHAPIIRDLNDTTGSNTLNQFSRLLKLKGGVNLKSCCQMSVTLELLYSACNNELKHKNSK